MRVDHAGLEAFSKKLIRHKLFVIRTAQKTDKWTWDYSRLIYDLYWFEMFIMELQSNTNSHFYKALIHKHHLFQQKIDYFLHFKLQL